MHPEDKALLEKTYELVHDNHRLLKKMHRSARRAQIFRALKWLIIIAILIFVYSFIKPYINQLKETYGNVSESVEQFQEIGTVFQKEAE